MRTFNRGHVIAITGASAGVGRAVALEFAKYGCKIALLARGKDNLYLTANAVEAAGGQPLVVPCDVSVASELIAAIARIETEVGAIDVLVNNAMVTVYAPLSDMSSEEYEQVTKVTYLGQVFATQAVLPSMRRRNSGTIIYVNSALGWRSVPFQAPYCAAKAAVRGFVDAVRCELRAEGSDIRLTSVYLPAVATPQFEWARARLGRHPSPVPPVFSAAAVAAAVVNAARTTPRDAWLGKSTVQAILGEWVAPQAVDAMLTRTAYDDETTSEIIAPRDGNLFKPGPTVSNHGKFGGLAAQRVTSIDPLVLRLGVLGTGALVFLSLAATLGLVTNARRRTRPQA